MPQLQLLRCQKIGCMVMVIAEVELTKSEMLIEVKGVTKEHHIVSLILVMDRIPINLLQIENILMFILNPHRGVLGEK